MLLQGSFLQGSFGKNRRDPLSFRRRELGLSLGWLLSFGGADRGFVGLNVDECAGDTLFLDGLRGLRNEDAGLDSPRGRLIANNASSGNLDASRSFLDPSRTKYLISSYSPIITSDTMFASLSESGACTKYKR